MLSTHHDTRHVLYGSQAQRDAEQTVANDAAMTEISTKNVSQDNVIAAHATAIYQLSNENFLKMAPKTVIEKEKSKLNLAQETLGRLKEVENRLDQVK